MLICVLCAAATSAMPFTILNPWTGRVEFSLAESASEDNRVAASAANPDIYQRPETARSDDEGRARSPEEKQGSFNINNVPFYLNCDLFKMGLNFQIRTDER